MPTPTPTPSPSPSSGGTWDATSVIITKRDGHILSDDAIQWFIDAYTRGDVADEQAAALAMAVFLNGLTEPELSTWTQAMVDSGDRVDLGDLGRPTVDKHSTGGVGDKVSLILVPLIAHCGAAVPQLAGRGLGHTGGTLDKMEAIPGWRAEMSPSHLRATLIDVGAVIAAASGDIAPADKKLYALRDITGTVASIPLIASSIMSKKIAEGTEALVLDVKVGRGAFMTNLDDARTLAETMVGIGERAGVRTTALLTRMDQPLGRTIGNSLEVMESVRTLEGAGPDDLVCVTVALAEAMLELTGIEADPATLLANGSAVSTWRAMVRAQGGDPDASLPVAGHQFEIRATGGGYITDLDALELGMASVRLGAGRARKEDAVSFGAGIEVLKKPGEAVQTGEPVLRLHADDPDRFPTAEGRVARAITIGPEPVEIEHPVIERIT